MLINYLSFGLRIIGSPSFPPITIIFAFGDSRIRKLFKYLWPLDSNGNHIFKFPKFFKSIVFDRIDSDHTGKISKAKFIEFWEKDYERLEVSKRMFKI